MADRRRLKGLFMLRYAHYVFNGMDCFCHNQLRLGPLPSKTMRKVGQKDIQMIIDVYKYELSNSRNVTYLFPPRVSFSLNFPQFLIRHFGRSFQLIIKPQTINDSLPIGLPLIISILQVHGMTYRSCRKIKIA